MSNARYVTVKILSEIERNNSYSNITSNNILREFELSKVDSALVSRLVYGVLQRKITLDGVLNLLTEKGAKKSHPFVLSALRSGLYQILFMDKIPPSAAVNETVNLIKQSKQRFASGFANAVLRKAANQKNDLLEKIDKSTDLSFKYSCPKELVDELVADYGSMIAEEFLKHSLLSPKTYCRLNSVKFSAEQLFKSFATHCVEYENVSQNGAFVLNNAGGIENLEEFKQGMFFVQDLASQIAIAALDIRPSMTVLDVCAAPGGKSFTAAQYVTKSGKIVSCDCYDNRVNLIKSGAKRLELEFIEAKTADATVYDSNFGRFDRIICDVPCSGIGVIRRKPEIKYKNLQEFGNLKEIQLSILENGVSYLKQDGKIMYSTCTLRKAENEDIVSSFLEKHTDFIIEKQETLMPQINDSDGFYYCVLKRKNSGQD